MALEGLYVPVNAPWYPDFLAELLSFPAGKHDDICDSLGLVGQTLDVMVKGNKPVPPEKPEGDISGYRPYRMDAQPGDWLTY
jgi:hypothetical protein